MMEWEVVNTQDKIYNDKRRTYIDKSDCKEGEVICRKCKGRGEIWPKEEYINELCPQCLGRGIVDWVTQAVERPRITFTDSSSSSSMSSTYVKGLHGTTGHGSPKLVKFVTNPGMIGLKQVTNYKRRKIV